MSQSTRSPITPLRQRMLEDMSLRGLREETQRDYIRCVRSFAAFLARSPDSATAEDIRRVQVHQAESGVQPPTVNGSVSALRFLFYDLLFRAASETRLTIAADPRHLGARIGLTAVLQTWGSALTHHPHVHRIVPGGGLSMDGSRWVSARPAFLLPVRVLGKLFRPLFLTGLIALHEAGRLAFSGRLANLVDRRAFLRHLSPVRKKHWIVYAKPPFAGPEVVLASLSRYTHRVAIANRRLIALDGAGVTFRTKDYRRDGADRQKVMTLAADAFIRRFLRHVLPKGFHRIRHDGLLASAGRKAHLARARILLAVPASTEAEETDRRPAWRPPCPCCGGRMIIIETIPSAAQPRAPPVSPVDAGMRAS